MTIERQYILARIVEGETIISRRVVPFPHRFYLGDVHEIEEAAVARLVAEKALAPTPDDALWDRITYRASSAFTVETLAREYWPKGFGRCVACDTILGAGLRSHSASEQDSAATAPRSRTPQPQRLGTARISRARSRPAKDRASRWSAFAWPSPRSRRCAVSDNPGSTEAQRSGCLCSPSKNQRGEGAGRNGRGEVLWIIAPRCPLHGPEKPKKAKRAA